MSEFLTYDDRNMWSGRVGGGGARKDEVKELKDRLAEAHLHISGLRQSGEQGFFDLPYDTKTAASLLRRAAQVKQRFNRLIVIGIGGSDLGARTIWQSLGKPHQGMRVSFLSNPDPELISRYAVKADWWKRTAINVVSKSGSTLETLAMFMAVRDALIKSVGAKKHAEHVFVTTDPQDNPLSRIADEYGYELLPHPLNVGGRFSALSAVGLFPAACGGVDVKRMLAGARWMEDAHRKDGPKNRAAHFATLHYLAMRKRGQRIHVLMPYAEWMRQFAFWYRQLWAESLGKDNKGPTPVAAHGVVDQHSQIQLYNDGPNDKVVTFIETERFRSRLRVPKVWKGIPGIEYIGGLDFGRIMHAEREGTAHALAQNGRPNGTLRIPSVTPESIGALFQFYMTVAAYMGELMGINAYTQPGVEEGKASTRRLLS